MSFWDFAHLHLFELILTLIAILVILIIFIFVIVYLLNRYSINVTSKWITLKPNTIPLTEYISRNTLVYGQLSLLRELMNADIAAVFSLHNGGKFNNGISVQKWTLTHESCADGIYPFYDIGLKYRDQLISQTDWIANSIVENLYFLDVSKIKENSAWRREFVRNSIDFSVLKLVQSENIQELVVGLFYKSPHQIEIEKFESSKLVEYSDKISSILKTGMQNS
jgi:hypothetical protein